MKGLFLVHDTPSSILNHSLHSYMERLNQAINFFLWNQFLRTSDYSLQRFCISWSELLNILLHDSLKRFNWIQIARISRPNGEYHYTSEICHNEPRFNKNLRFGRISSRLRRWVGSNRSFCHSAKTAKI